MTAREAAEYMRISKRKMWQLLSQGVLASQDDPLDGRVKLVKRADVEALLAKSKKVAA